MSEKKMTKKEEAELQKYDFGEDEGAGYEHQTSADMTIPFIILLQPMSPLVAEEKKADAGQFFNTVTEQIYDGDEGFLFTPGTTRHYFAEWTPRKQGGGFHGHHPIDDPRVEAAVKAATKFGQNKTPEGTEMRETFYVYGGVSSEVGFAESMAVMALAGTKIKPYKTWMSRIRQFVVPVGDRLVKPPMFSNLTRVTSVMRKGDEGPYYVPKFSSADPRGLKESIITREDSRYQMAKACAMLVDSGDAVVKPEQQNAQSTDGINPDTDLPF